MVSEHAAVHCHALTAVAHVAHASLTLMAHLNCWSGQCSLRINGYTTRSAMGRPGPISPGAMHHTCCVGSSGRERVIPHQYFLGSSVSQLASQVAQPLFPGHARASRAQLKVVLNQQASFLAPAWPLRLIMQLTETGGQCCGSKYSTSRHCWSSESMQQLRQVDRTAHSAICFAGRV